MAKLPFLTLASTVNDLRTTTNDLNNLIGDLALLNTSGDSDLVQAINALDSDVDSRLNILDSDLGNRLSLNSIDKTDIVSAYNELRLRVDLIDSAQAVTFDSAFNSIAVLEGRADSNDTNFVTRVRGSISSGGDISYNPATGVFSIDVEQIYTKANFDSDLDLAFATNAVTTTDLTEGTNLYFTNARARGAISVTDASGDGSISYNSTSGVITYTGPSASEVRAHLSAGEGIDFVDGVISGEDASTSNKGVASFNSSRFTVTSGDVDIATGGIGSTQLASGAAATNIGLTATATELNYTDGVTSSIQTQLDNKQPLDSDLTAIAALTPTDGNFIVGNGSAWVTESGNTVLQSLGVTATATELNYVDGVTSDVQTQLNAKANNTSASIATSISLTGAASAWQFALSGNNLIIKYGATTVAQLDTSGNLTVKGDVTAFGSI